MFIIKGPNGVHHQHPTYATILRTNSQHSAMGGQGGGGAGVGAGHHTLGPSVGGGGGGGGPSAHYFRPIAHPHGIYTGRPGAHDDFDITSDSDAITSPDSSIIGPPPVPPGVGRPSSPPHHLLSYPNGGVQPPPQGPPNPPGILTFSLIFFCLS
jgi:hypothetical protein